MKKIRRHREKIAVVLSLFFLMNLAACTVRSLEKPVEADPKQTEAGEKRGETKVPAGSEGNAEAPAGAEESAGVPGDAGAEESAGAPGDAGAEESVKAPGDAGAAEGKTEIPPSDSPSADTPLTGAPALGLADALSSARSEFSVQSGNYSWSYLEEEELTELVACGAYPLDRDPEESEKLYIPDYQGTEAVAYLVSCAAVPDRLTVREWDVSQIGHPEARENSFTAYEQPFLIKLKPDKVYEITAFWEEEKLETNGFYGEASYVVVTASR